MLNQINKKIKFFDQQIIPQSTTKNIKKVTKEANSGYLATLCSTDSVLVDNYIQLVTYFV